MNSKIFLVVGAGDHAKAEETAFRSALSSTRNIVIISIVDSFLYHYGHTDVINTRPSKRAFLLHVRSEALQKAADAAQAVRERANAKGIAAEIIPVETDDPAAAIAYLAREEKSGAVYIPLEKTRFFPLLKRSLATDLRRKLSAQVVAC
ncbi:MAG: hypothetical protein HY895_01505 [Deltaproteobacteria bacterium]|nr:hypothetical protein [Deltaproteobacteria bacterium]